MLHSPYHAWKYDGLKRESELKSFKIYIYSEWVRNNCAAYQNSGDEAKSIVRDKCLAVVI